MFTLLGAVANDPANDQFDEVRRDRECARGVGETSQGLFSAASRHSQKTVNAEPNRRRVYSTETVDVDVRVSTENELWQIAGQLPGSLCAGGEVDLEGDSFSATAKLNELCEFSFSSVPGGTYTLALHLLDVIIETPPLELGP